MVLTLIYPHQLFRNHPAIAKGREVWLIEDPLFFGNDPHWPIAMHLHKLMLHRASIKAYAAELEAAGQMVKFIEVPAGSTSDGTDLPESGLPDSVMETHLADPADHLFNNRLGRFSQKRGVRTIRFKVSNEVATYRPEKWSTNR